MQSLEALLSSLVEYPQLQRPHCDQCRIAIADYDCQRCNQRFCRQCELVIHHRLAVLAIKHEESKSDGRPHQEFLTWTSACQECGQNTQEFFCLNCSMYQCENCCATKHRQLEPHFFFCVDGSSPRMFPFASWNLMLVEMVKVSTGKLQDSAAAAEGAMTYASNTANEELEVKYSTSAAAHIKLEKATAAATAAALGNLSINGPVAVTHPPQSQAKHSSRVNTTSIVDLTLDDETDASTSSSTTRPPAQPQIKEELRVKTENTWLASATAAQQNPVLDVDELMEKAMGDDEDPILRSMIGNYNELSANIFEIDQEADRVKKKTKELTSVKPINMQEVQKARTTTLKLRKDKAEAEKARDGVVADIVVYVKPDPEDMAAFLETCTADVPTAQTAIHRKCATLEASIQSKLEGLQRTQQHMEELIGLKKDALAEVTRLGADVAQGEEEIRKLDKERQGEFLTLCQFSKSIQTAVREATGSV
ncbi:hypothetical protein PPTG_04849 [Phytophthora nicotianae INRA-310]|uniref:B box-type domain-containing protein n=6 Tax=Phytophthora nicotianae TaxID=4792 RepID=W2R2A3_PHYN3|nr:hypothetical protein PPTG_04849 [Phytophthora nicotianae INRA-310]ETL32066.1 hypothetical protein L916_15282 [Phytophthora nicotianae]ETM38466.1 hypothetical protein L914_15241 [Phytophthora nicotianae]ETN19577.1 hypothetical protein PPTG_04849 [Phytophthora nicotianae INRA-310]ETO67206.1 hypothetical protein F444_15812 [Phytophthora nicotianae P1976]